MDMLGWWPAGSTAQWVKELKKEEYDPKEAASVALVGTVQNKVRGGEIERSEAVRVLEKAGELMADDPWGETMTKVTQALTEVY
ncbi:MAG: hypothetical protein HKO65_18290 [Gemmatimonadetes bacterium]|nr:hypothetical protein [Gemmatimonadota bacterium]NNM07048.1 hypothetical protein [Gemmatimonadota bacterium]